MNRRGEVLGVRCAVLSPSAPISISPLVFPPFSVFPPSASRILALYACRRTNAAAPDITVPALNLYRDYTRDEQTAAPGQMHKLPIAIFTYTCTPVSATCANIRASFPNANIFADNAAGRKLCANFSLPLSDTRINFYR